MALSSNEYLLLVQQRFQCVGTPGYTCPLTGYNFDEAGYEIVSVGDQQCALCPSCFRVHTNAYPKTPKLPTSPTPPPQIPCSVEAKQRVIYFMTQSKYRMGGSTSFDKFWNAFYAWSENQKLFTKKSRIRGALAKLCGVPHNSQTFPVSV